MMLHRPLADDHDVMLVGPDSRVLIHEEGLFAFHCTMHQPETSGQIVVLPGRSA